MENLVGASLFGAVYQGTKVLVTGHTGFKGSWLCQWLSLMGADVSGYALAPQTEPNHFDLLHTNLRSEIGDICDSRRLNEFVQAVQPEIVFHLAAQPLVRESYQSPVRTVAVNVLGTAEVLEAARQCSATRAFINVTTDKCYENSEQSEGYRESDRLGGRDPYSASKACSELITASYRDSFDSKMLIATARAGNVIGGGDWAEDRLIPDVVRARTGNRPVVIRNPEATRPWQHVLEPLAGYLLLGQRLLEAKAGFAKAWNFGPDEDLNLTVGSVLQEFNLHWPIEIEYDTCGKHPHEAKLLALDCALAKRELGWSPLMNKAMMFSLTVEWYRHFYEQGQCLTCEQINGFVRLARESGATWA